MPKTATYHIKIERTGKYDCVALLVDMTAEKPDSTRLVAKSMEELMAKALVAVVLHDKNVTVDEESAGDKTIIISDEVRKKISVNPKDAPSSNGNGDVPIILTPSRKVVR